ncbi:MAG: hypothetical protein ACI4KR_09785 [Ruminiclostridium sp.]
MPILSNINGTLKSYTSIFTNVGGTLKEFEKVYENTGGTLHTIYEKPGAFTVTITGGGGAVSNITTSTTTHTAYAVVGFLETYGTTFEAPGTGYVRIYSASGTFYPVESCKVVVSGSSTGTFSFKINDVEKGAGTFSITPSDKCAFSLSVQASFSTPATGTMTVELKS